MYIDVQVRQLHKMNEELCGDSVGVHRTPRETVLVLADGLGSGVKASILATLTQKIALTMFREQMPLSAVVETLAGTLPICQVRNLAYSTFTLVRIREDGQTELVEFDNPPTFIFRDGMLEEIPREERTIGKFTLYQSQFQLQEGDCLVAVSDGVIHAGIGGLEPLGWRWEEVADYLQGYLGQDMEAEEIAENLIGAASGLYRDNVGDDTSVAVMKCRPFRRLTIAIGPPADPEKDKAMVDRFWREPGAKIVCGGTTAKIISRESGKPLSVELNNVSRDLPPTGKIDGVDLVTEGVITIMHTVDALEHVRLRKPRVNVHDLNYMYGRRDSRAIVRDSQRRTLAPQDENPAEQLARQLRLADKVTILLGTALNPAHQNPDLPVHLGLKFHLVDHLAEKLRAREKDVEIVRY